MGARWLLLLLPFSSHILAFVAPALPLGGRRSEIRSARSAGGRRSSHPTAGWPCSCAAWRRYSSRTTHRPSRTWRAPTADGRRTIGFLGSNKGSRFDSMIQKQSKRARGGGHLSRVGERRAVAVLTVTVTVQKQRVLQDTLYCTRTAAPRVCGLDSSSHTSKATRAASSLLACARAGIVVYGPLASVAPHDGAGDCAVFGTFANSARTVAKPAQGRLPRG